MISQPEFEQLLGKLNYLKNLKLSMFDNNVNVSMSDEPKLLDFRTYNSATNSHFRVIFHNNYYEQIYNILIKNDKLTEFMDDLEKIIMQS